MNYYTYILYNIENDKFYIGQTNNLVRRVKEHNSNKSIYTAKYQGKWRLVYYKIHDLRVESMKQEKDLKKQKNKNFYKKFVKNNSVG